jgi:hypothetical protein
VETSTVRISRLRGGGVVARYWVLKGQSLWAVFGRPVGLLFGPGSGPGPHRRGARMFVCVVRAGGPVVGLGFGGVFVNWIVDASI